MDYLNRHIIFDFKEDVRNCYKQGEQLDIELDFYNPCYIVGKNGCGKSTILQCMRSKKDSLSELMKTRRCLIPTNIDIWTNDDSIEISGLEQFDNIFYLDSIVDDPMSFENSCDAGSFVGGGAFGLMNASKGQKTIHLLDSLVKDIDKILKRDKGDNEIPTSTNLIVLDEIDEGFDLFWQMRFYKLVHAIALRSNAYLICVTHNPLCYINGADKVFSIEERKYIPTQDYLKSMTDGYTIKIEKENDD